MSDYYPFGAEHNTSKTGDYAYRYNGKEKELGLDLGLLRYGARDMDPWTARFRGVDPIADEFPHVSPYNYAENRVPNGIDLHGLQFVHAREAQYSISNFQTWQNTGRVESGKDAFGQSYIGTSVPVNRVSLSVPDNSHRQGIASAMRSIMESLETRRQGLQTAKSTGAPDLRFNTTQTFNKDVRGIGRVGLAMEMVNLANDVNNAYRGYQKFFGIDENSKQLRYIDRAWRGVIGGLNAGLFETNQITAFNLNSVADFLYRGTEIDNPDIQVIGNKIAKTLGILKPRITEINRESGLDNFRLQPILDVDINN